MTGPPTPVRNLDCAFGCFAFLGLTILAGMTQTFVEPGNRGAYAMMVGLLLFLPALIALVIAIPLTVMSRRYRPIVILCVVTLLLLAESLSHESAAWICGAVAMLVPAWWFAAGRRRYKGQMASA
jgi:hypothetical protein